MIDEIDYFPKRDKYKSKKKVDDDWNQMKQLKRLQNARTNPTKNPPEKHKKETDSKD